MRSLVLSAVISFSLSSLSYADDSEERRCFFAAAAKLPTIAGMTIDGSRVGKEDELKIRTVEIDAQLAGKRLTYVFNCFAKQPTTANFAYSK